MAAKHVFRTGGDPATSSRHSSRRGRAVGLLPVALLSAAWTVGLSGSDSDAATNVHRPAATPSNAPLPPAFRADLGRQPASLPIPGEIGPSVRNSEADDVLASAESWEIPGAALAAYQRAAQAVDSTEPGCHLDWELLAAIGRVESDHGRFRGSQLDRNGVSTPAIYGPRLDGHKGTQSVADTDGGQLDRDSSHDRAVGPMQFLPSTWSAVKVDGDGDGQRNPQDIDDAALGAAVYLCAGDQDLSTDAGRQAALFRYNRSVSYGLLVLQLMKAYSQGVYAEMPAGTYSGTALAASETKSTRSQSRPDKTAGSGSGGSNTDTRTPHESGGSSADDGTNESVSGAGSDPASGLVTAIPAVLTRAQATTICLQRGIAALNVLALTRCVTDLLAPTSQGDH